MKQMNLKNTLILIGVLGIGYYAYRTWKRSQYKEVIEDESFTIYIKE